VPCASRARPVWRGERQQPGERDAIAPARHGQLGLNGTAGELATYSGFIFTARVVEIVRAAAAGGAAAAPLFVYWVRRQTTDR
jgi:hypothetical protein